MKFIKYDDQIVSLENVREVYTFNESVTIYYKDTDKKTIICTYSNQDAKSLLQDIWSELIDTSGKEN